MPTKKSSTVIKPKTTEADRFARLSTWTKGELAELQHTSNVPVCIHLANGDYTVGPFSVKMVSSAAWQVGEAEFGNSRTAVFFCVAMYLRRKVDAAELLLIDEAISNLELEKLMFRERLNLAHLVADQFKIDLYSSRFTETKNKLQRAKRDLEKAINKIRYIMMSIE